MPDSVCVRMYDVGFGDCFLLEFPRSDREPFRVLVDCGTHRAGYPRRGWKPEEAVKAVLADVGAPDAPPRLDVVVATHRHQDHVSGFACRQWGEVEVGEVWMPWTENPDDPEATAIRNRQTRLALGLERAFAAQRFTKRWAAASASAEALQAMAANAAPNEAAMRTLHRGFRGRPPRRFLSAGEDGGIEPPACPGLVVHVLGPSRSPDVIRDMDPPSGQSYLRGLERLGDPRTPTGDGRHRPFARHFTVHPSDLEAAAPQLAVPDKIKNAAVAAMRADDMAVTVSLDKAVNGTSLMLLFEFRGAYLLFPGDAQWGTWSAAMRDPAARDLLARTTFYKIGHHGSHNATPVDFLETVLPSGTPLWGAAASVHRVKAWPQIPRQPLLEKLRTRSQRVVCSDQPGAGDPETDVRPGVAVDFHVPVTG